MMTWKFGVSSATALKDQLEHPSDLAAIVIGQDVRVTEAFGILVCWEIDLGGLIQDEETRHWPLILTKVMVKHGNSVLSRNVAAQSTECSRARIFGMIACSISSRD
jgi:hypothetical protein